MIRAVSIIALAALASLLSGCGCSREKTLVDEAKGRMHDATYTNMLVQTRLEQVKIASRAAAIKAKIESLGADAASHPEYADLTNDLARCKAEAEMLNKMVRMAIRDRLTKDLKAKGDLKK